MIEMKNLGALFALLGSWAQMLPTVWRKRIYKGVKVVSALLTLAILVLPMLSDFGVSLPEPDRWLALFTALLTAIGHLADSNTEVVDEEPAPEPTP